MSCRAGPDQSQPVRTGSETVSLVGHKGLFIIEKCPNNPSQPRALKVFSLMLKKPVSPALVPVHFVTKKDKAVSFALRADQLIQCESS